jgi:hypothetical protein
MEVIQVASLAAQVVTVVVWVDLEGGHNAVETRTIG